jgi:hypothetical protein
VRREGRGGVSYRVTTGEGGGRTPSAFVLSVRRFCRPELGAIVNATALLFLEGGMRRLTREPWRGPVPAIFKTNRRQARRPAATLVAGFLGGDYRRLSLPTSESAATKAVRSAITMTGVSMAERFSVQAVRKCMIFGPLVPEIWVRPKCGRICFPNLKPRRELRLVSRTGNAE